MEEMQERDQGWRSERNLEMDHNIPIVSALVELVQKFSCQTPFRSLRRMSWKSGSDMSRVAFSSGGTQQ